MSEEDISVVVEDDAQTNLASADEKKTVTLDPAVAELKAQHEELLAEERKRAEAAERRASEARAREDAARRETVAARTEVVDSQLDTVTSGIAAAQAEAESAERAYKAAFEAGDAAAMASAQRQLARAEAKSVRLDEAKADLEARKAAPPTPAQRQSAVDPVESYIAGRTEPTANWLRAHRDWITDPKKNARLTAAHFDAVADGLSVDTDAYFDAVETKLGLKEGAAKTNGQVKPARRASPPVAPVVTTGGGTSGAGSEVMLTAGEARAAQDGTLVWNYDDPSPQKRFKKGEPIGLQEFARRKREMQRKGLYDKQYTEA